MRRLLVVPLFALAIGSATASAASWHSFSSKPLGFSVRYPASWKLLTVNQQGAKQVQFSYQGTQTYNVTVNIVRMNGGSSLAVLKQRFLAYERQLGNTTIASVHWTAASLGGRKGMGGVYVPATEGGTSVSTGMYVIPWRSNVYIVNLMAVQHPAPTRLDQFPAVYKQMLASWRFQ